MFTKQLEMSSNQSPATCTQSVAKLSSKSLITMCELEGHQKRMVAVPTEWTTVFNRQATWFSLDEKGNPRGKHRIGATLNPLNLLNPLNPPDTGEKSNGKYPPMHRSC